MRSEVFRPPSPDDLARGFAGTPYQAELFTGPTGVRPLPTDLSEQKPALFACQGVWLYFAAPSILNPLLAPNLNDQLTLGIRLNESSGPVLPMRPGDVLCTPFERIYYHLLSVSPGYTAGTDYYRLIAGKFGQIMPFNYANAPTGIVNPGDLSMTLTDFASVVVGVAATSVLTALAGTADCRIELYGPTIGLSRVAFGDATVTTSKAFARVATGGGGDRLDRDTIVRYRGALFGIASGAATTIGVARFSA